MFGQAHLSMPDGKTELSYDAECLYIDRHSWKQQIGCFFKQFNSLVLEFCSQNSLSKSDCLILVHEISPEWLDLLTSVFLQQLSFMIETN